MYHQQWHLLRQLGVHDPNPRKQFRIDLSLHLQAVRQPNHKILLLIDANDTTAKPQGCLSTLIANQKLINVVTYCNQEELSPPPSTYMRGTLLLDYALMTPGLASFVTQAGYDPFGALFHSDHRGIVIDIKLTEFLESPPSTVGSVISRGVSTRDPTRLREYLQSFHTYEQQHNLFARAEALETKRLQPHLTTEDLQKMHHANSIATSQEACYMPNLNANLAIAPLGLPNSVWRIR